MHRLGVRVASIAHWGRTALADGSGEDATGSRLTAPGVAALREMERLGMIFDVSHLGASGVAHVLELATRPVMATHSSARALRDHHRNLTDDQIRGVAATGGVICVNFLPGFLAEDPADFTVDRLVDHIEHVAGVGRDRPRGPGPRLHPRGDGRRHPAVLRGASATAASTSWPSSPAWTGPPACPWSPRGCSSAAWPRRTSQDRRR